MNLAVLKLSFYQLPVSVLNVPYELSSIKAVYLFPVSVLNVPYELSSIKAVFLSVPGICFECAI